MQANITRQELFIRFALVLVCLGFWRSELNFVSFSLLGIAWLLDGGLYRLNQAIKEPIVQAILLLCTLLLLGLFWSELLEFVEIDVMLDPIFIAFGQTFFGQSQTNLLTACRMRRVIKFDSHGELLREPSLGVAAPPGSLRWTRGEAGSGRDGRQ